MAIAMNGPMNAPNPDGVPRFRRVILVRPADVVSHVYVVSIGNGPCAVRMTNRWPGENSTISYVYANRRPRNCATKAIFDPTETAGCVCHSTDLMLTYQAGALSGFAAYDATVSQGRS